MADPLKVVDRAICVVKQPAEFRDRIQNGWLVPIPGGKFHALAVNGTKVYGTGGEDSDIYLADTGAKTVQKIADLPATAAGIMWMAANEKAVTWLEVDDKKDYTRWSLHLADADGARARKVSGTPKNQPEATGGGSFPALVGNRLVWDEFDSATEGSNLKVMDLADSSVRSIALDYPTTPLAMGDTIVWQENLGDESGVMHAVDAATLEPRELPTDLPYDGGIGHTAATSNLLLWATSDYQTLKVWNATAHRVDVFQVPAKVDQIFQFLQPTGTHLTWYTNWPYSLMDLETGVVVDLGTEVSTAAGGGAVAISYTKRNGSTKGATYGPAHLTVLPEGELPSPDRGSCPGA